LSVTKGKKGSRRVSMRERGLGESVYGEKFRIILKMIPHPEGESWSGTKMERATGGKVSTSYYSALRDGHVGVPSAEKIGAIAEAMNFAPGLWFKSVGWWEDVYDRWQRGEDVGDLLGGNGEKSYGGRVSELLKRLFEVKLNEKTGKPYTNREVARESGGILAEEDVQALRDGRVGNPTWAQILALCDVFDVDASYWSTRRDPWKVSPNVLRAVEEQDSYEIFQTSLRLSDSSRSILKILSEHLEEEGRRAERARMNKRGEERAGERFS
jgi:transcriptional regulator with XRE-family HTH domain